MSKTGYCGLLLFIALIMVGCASTQRQTAAKARNSATYTSSFPRQDVSQNLLRIQQSIRRITTTATYKTYAWGQRNITLRTIKKYPLKETAARSYNTNHSKAGTAIAIMQNGNYTAFLTARHVVSFPDTLIAYKNTPGAPQQTFVKSIGIKNKQRSYVYHNDKVRQLTVRAEDEFDDLALITIKRTKNRFYARPLSIKTGIANDLTLGSFLYVMGYPLGTPMVTRAIVSAPNYDKSGEFLTDGLFNHGISGGIIIATRNDFNSFEWVGMASDASAYNISFLAPNPAKEKLYNNLDTYSDTVFVKKRELINYGLTQAISINKILLFLYKNEDALNKIGFSSTNLENQ